MLASLPGERVSKHRHQLDNGSIDVYGEGDLHIFEIEFAALDAATRYLPPPFVEREITGDADYSGRMLARRFN